jgi:hypothetical protein
MWQMQNFQKMGHLPSPCVTLAGNHKPNSNL